MPKLPRNIYRRGNSYYLRVQVGGRRIARSLGTDLTEARRLALLILADLRHGHVPERVAPRAQSVGEFSERWLREHVRLRRNPKNVAITRQRLRDHVLPVLGPVPLTELGIADIRGLRADLDASGLAPQTVHHVLSDVRAMCRYAAKLKLISETPVEPEVFPRLQERAPRRLDAAALGRVVAATPAKYRLAVILALETGLRWGELHRLAWADVDWQAGELRIEGTKSGRVRWVPCTAEALQVLREAHRAATGGHVLPHRGTNPDAFVRIIRRRSGVRFTFHQLRHTFACQFLESGGDREALRLMLGHSSLRMTHRYGQASREWLREQVATVVATRTAVGP